MEKPSEGKCRTLWGRNVPENQATVGAQGCQATVVAEGWSTGTELKQWHSLLPSKLGSCSGPAQTFLPALQQLILHLSLLCRSFNSISRFFCEGMHVTGTAACLGESRSSQSLWWWIWRQVQLFAVQLHCWECWTTQPKGSWEPAHTAVCNSSCLHYGKSLTQTDLSPEKSDIKHICRQDTEEAMQAAACLLKGWA